MKTAAPTLMAEMLDLDNPEYEEPTDEDPIRESGYYADNNNNFERPARKSSLKSSELSSPPVESERVMPSAEWVMPDSEDEDIEINWFGIDLPENPLFHVSGSVPKNEPAQLFHKAVSEFRHMIRPGSKPTSFDTTQATYNSRNYKPYYHIPLGDRTLNIGEDEINVRLNGKLVRAVVDTKANYNLISRTTQMLTRAVTVHSAAVNDNNEDVEYCTDIRIEIERNLFLPGIFLVTDEYITGGYDLVLGKPWMIGIERHFARTKFESPSSNIPAKEEANIFTNSDSEDDPFHKYMPFVLANVGKESWKMLESTPQIPEEAAVWLKKREHEGPSRVGWPKKRQRGNKEGPQSQGLGGSFAWTL